MANSKSSPANNVSLLASIHQFLAPLIGARPYANTTILLAYSGGLDSTVLLALLVALQSRLTFTLKVMHVHHGISPHANTWAEFCKTTCSHYGLSCEVRYVDLASHRGLGLEAAARHARYAQLNQEEADFIALAHHQNDQAETLMLQLARGAGVKGLSGMAPIDHTRRLIRPLLSAEREMLLAYAQAQQLRWIEDESNDDTTYARNFMRHEVLPVLARQYPSIHVALSRTAAHMAEASELLDALASQDAKQAMQTQPYSLFPCLDTRFLNNLTAARAHNLLRYWLAQVGVLMPSTAHLTQLRQQLLNAALDASVQVKVSEQFSVRCYQHFAYLVSYNIAKTISEVAWQGEKSLALGHGSLHFERVVGQGLSLSKLAGSVWTVSNRVGGEKLRPVHGSPSRSLKSLLQTAQIPPWLRISWPLLKVQQQLVCVPNVANECSWQAEANELGVVVHWQPQL